MPPQRKVTPAQLQFLESRYEVYLACDTTVKLTRFWETTFTAFKTTFQSDGEKLGITQYNAEGKRSVRPFLFIRISSVELFL